MMHYTKSPEKSKDNNPQKLNIDLHFYKNPTKGFILLS